MNDQMIIGVIIGAAFSIAVFLYIARKREQEGLGERLEKHLADIIPRQMQDAREQLVELAKLKLGAEKQEIRVDLENKRAAIEKMVAQVSLDLRDAGRTAQSIKQQMKDHADLTAELRVTTEGLRKVLTNNQLRGQFGEQVAEDLLKMAGFVKGVDFEFNKATGPGSSRPDFTIFMPDKTKINVDVKFPYASLQKATETEDKESKKLLLKQFALDVREKIKQISTRDYINTSDKTVDFVILFVPNEMIFSYIYEKMNPVWQEAMEKKVVMAGPFSFTAILRMVRQAYDNFRYQENIGEIVGLIHQFDKQFELYNEEFDKLGSQIRTVTDTYSRVESTRTKQLTRVVEKIKLDSGSKSMLEETAKQ